MRSAILIRRSKDDRTEEPEEVMLAACTAYLKKHGYACDIKEDVYKDIGETGGVVLNNGRVELPLDRPAVKRLLGRLERYNAVCLYKYDRLGRDQLSIGLLPYVLLSQGLKVLSPIDGDLDPDQPESKFLFNMKGYLSEAERKNIRQRSMDALKVMRDQGKLAGQGRPRYGYTYERLGPGKRAGRRRIIDPATAPVVKRIFEAVAGGRSLRAVCAELTSEGIPSPQGGQRWNARTLEKMIKEPSYKGEAFQSGRELSVNIKVRSRNGKTYSKHVLGKPIPIGDGTPTIVDQDLWRQANAALSKRYKPPTTTFVCETWLRGRIRCGNCGTRMTLERRYGIWMALCGGKRESRCFTQARLTLVEEHAWATAVMALSRPDLLRKSMLLEADDDSLVRLETTLRNLDSEHEKLQAKKARLVDLVIEEADPIAREAFRTRLHETTGEIDSNRRMAADLDGKLGELSDRRREAERVVDRVQSMMDRLNDADAETMAKVADMIGLRCWVKAATGKRYYFIACIPEGIAERRIEDLQGKVTEFVNTFVEDAGKGKYPRRKEA